MSADQNNPNDPLSFVRNLWGSMGFNLPGMVTPTFDVEELDKRIKDMKAVEGWLRMNLSMLQMTIQNLEMQRTTVSTVQAMSKMASEAAQSVNQAAGAAEQPAAGAAAGAFSEAAMWPWQMMQQMREQMEQQAAAGAAAASEASTPDESAGKPRRTPKKQ